jgi:ankyrin repeat protein
LREEGGIKMSESILEKSLKERSDREELLQIVEDLDRYTMKLKSTNPEISKDVMDVWQKFINFIRDDVPNYLSQHALNTVPHVITLLSELKTRNDIKNGKLTLAQATTRAGGWDKESFVSARLIDIAVSCGSNINSLQAGIPLRTIGLPALHYASYINNYNCASTLLSRGSKTDILCKKENIPLHYAFSNDNQLVVKDTEPNADLLREYIAVSSQKMRKLLIEKTKDLNTTSKNGFTALHYIASSNTSNDKVSPNMLIEKGASPNIKDNFGNVPLHLAATNGNNNLVQVLAKFKANLDIQNKDGRTPLHMAAISNKTATYDKLIELGCNPEITDKYGKKPMQYVVNQKLMERSSKNKDMSYSMF